MLRCCFGGGISRNQSGSQTACVSVVFHFNQEGREYVRVILTLDSELEVLLKSA